MTRLATLALRGLLALYRCGLSPFTPPCCRFLPSCSAYAEEALARHGLGRGLALTLGRLARCHPMGGHGFDPVPEDGGGRRRRAGGVDSG